MKETNCLSYSQNTETEIKEIGSAYGKPLYSEKEIVISEYCSLLKKLDDFDCTHCVYKTLRNKQKENNNE